MIILGIETSCDETAVSIVEANGDLDDLSFNVLGSTVNSQIEIHREYGGVFPALAKREHQKNLLPVLIESLRKANLIFNFQFSILNEFSNANFQNKKPEEIWSEFLEKVEKPKIDLIVVTVGPGLEPALWTGINFAEELGRKWNIPVVGANHMEGHLASVLINKTDENSKPQNPNSKNEKINFPAIGLLISGGHTELIYLKNWKEKEKIGETQDDAVGEAFDKVARMLGLLYPGGPEISKLAEEARQKNIELETKFPRPMIHSKDLNFSFSGLKTAVLYYLRKSSPPIIRNDNSNVISAPLSLSKKRGLGGEDVPQEKKLAVAREFEDAVIETLLYKTKSAIVKYNPKTLIIGGGVIANKALRENFLNLKKDFACMEILIPEKSLTTDNATMITAAGYIEYLNKGNKKPELKASGNLDIN